ncbi:S-adenosyl-L-methionine-dependent methyltransferase [Sesbania bispinosa]|nr:S-adenosyl-L-methionine-dependent methyltransferase [Sesbania bispinosa]
MALSSASNFLALCITNYNSTNVLSFLLNPTFALRPLRFPSRTTIRATSALVLDSDLSTQQDQAKEVDFFACPICYEPLIRKGPFGLNLYLDLTVTAGLRDYTEVQPVRTELFRSPLVSFLYERGWRQNFRQSGFPGPDEEFKMAQEYFEPAQGGLIVDVSCGSGLFSRNNIALVRADVSRLPFSSGSVDAVHAGAALHCWPSPSNAVAEITRILRSGGIFVGTTFLRYTSSTPWFVRPLRERTSQGYSYLTEEEIKDLCTSCGLTNYSSKIQQSFIMFTAQKP